MNYEDKLRLAKEALASGSYDKETIEYIFPELRESEDKRIRRELIEYLKQRSKSGFNQEVRICNDGIIWLEKQGEQKPNPVPDWMPKFLDELRSKKNYFDWDEHKDIEGGILAIIKWMNPNYFNEKDGEQKPAWSEEDKANTDAVWKACGQVYGVKYQSILGDWLKSLKDRVQPKQEWSEEEIDLLLSNLDRNIKEFVTTDEFENEIGGHYWAIAKHAFLLGLGYNQNWKPSEEQLTALKNAIIGKRGPLYDLYFDLEKL